MRPIIGITCSRLVGGQWSQYSAGHFMDYTFDDYSRAVVHAGGAPLIVPAAHQARTLADVLERLDGLLLSGGPDIHPRFYREQPLPGLGEVDEPLDRMELEAARRAYQLGLPILGICRGIQTLNVALRGTLYQDIAAQVPDSIEHRQTAAKDVNTHAVTIEVASRLHAVLGRSRIWVNGKHHQAVKKTGRGLHVSARASDGVIEALEDPTKPFVVGVQWHPEGTWRTDPLSRKLFRAFVRAADGRAGRR
jgi:putative glutamine amidotransferase